jgi:hemolysin activation/secretion protein
LTVPVPAPPPEAASLRQGPRFVLRDVNIIGNTVLDEAAIRGVVDPYLGKPVTTGDLEEIRRLFTLLYINRGYINSGAIIPDQSVANGVVAFRFVEGRVNVSRFPVPNISIRNISVHASLAAPNRHSMSRIWGASNRSCCKARW